MLTAWPPSRGSSWPTRSNHVLLVGLLVVLLSQSAPVRAHAAPLAGQSSPAADPPAQTATDADRTAGARLPEIALDKSRDPAQLAGIGLQLLDPDAAAGDTEDGFQADIRRWVDIFVVDYQTFLPLIAMFVAIGTAALAYVIRRRLPVARAGFQAGASRGAHRPIANRGVILTRVAVQRSTNAASRPRGPDRSRIKPGPVPPSPRR